MDKNFVVIDTEGKDELTEIAIIDAQGVLIYEAFVKDHPSNENIRLKLKTRQEILTEFLAIGQFNSIVCHYAEHDVKIISNSFKKLALPWTNLKFICTFELAKLTFTNLPSYSLEYLSKYLGLKIKNKYFNPNFAHTAKYDALFTHQLYLKILLHRHA
jgi:DNA polymerase III epsilon subunit-like protein